MTAAAVGAGAAVDGRRRLLTFTGHVLSFGPAEVEHAPGWLTPAAVGVAVAGILLAWLTYQRRAINADTAGRGVRADPPRRAREVLDRRPVRRRLSAWRCFAFSRVIGWLDRYLVDGVLNVAQRMDARRRRRAADDADRPGAGLRLRRRRRRAHSDPLDAVGARVTGFPVLSRHDLGAVRRARSSSWRSRATGRCSCAGRRSLGATVSLRRVGLGLLGLRPCGGRLPVPGGVRRSCRRSASRICSPSTA